MKWWLKLLITVISLVVVAFFGISIFLGNSMTKVKRVPIEESPTRYNLTYESVSFSSINEELILYGWFLPVEDSRQIIIIVHGADGNRADPTIGLLDIASKLIEHGYNVLMFDLRGHGESEGNRMSAGYYEKRDLLGAVEYVKKCGFEDIGVLGFSMGAATALITTAESKDIDAVVADSSYADLKNMMEPEFSKRTKFPRFFLSPLLFMVKIMYGVDFVSIRPVESVPEIAPRPVFFIHGELDETVPVGHAYRLLEASQNPEDQLWVVSGAGHVRAYVTQPEEYIDRITVFFDGVLK